MRLRHNWFHRIWIWLGTSAVTTEEQRAASDADGEDPALSAVGTSRTADNSQIPPELFDAPNTYVFDLAPIRKKLVDHWDQVGPSVYRLANRFLQNSLDCTGTVQRFDNSYVITFDHLKGTHAHAAGQQLYDQFRQLLFQGKDSVDLEVSRKARKYKAPVRRNRDGGFFTRAFTRIKTIFEYRDAPKSAGGSETGNAGKQTAADQAASRSSDKAASGGKRSFAERRRTDGISTERGRTRVGARIGSRHAGALEDDCRSHSVPKEDPLTDLKMLREARMIENAMAADILSRAGAWSDELAKRVFPPPNLSYLYRSMWNLKSEHLTTYTSVPISWKSNMEVFFGEDVVPSPRRPENLLALDVLLLENTIQMLERLIKRKRQVLFMTSVHASTLANKESLEEYLAVARTIAKPARGNLIFEIVDIGDYANQREAIQMVKHLSPYARAVTASIGLDDRNFAFWKQCGLMAVGADLSRDQRPETELVNIFANFTLQARRNKLLSYLRELDKLSTVINALSFGFDFLEGAVIGSGDDPDNLVLSEFQLENLYK